MFIGLQWPPQSPDINQNTALLWFGNRRFVPEMCSQQILCNVTMSTWNPRNISSSLLNPCNEKFRLFWGQRWILLCIKETEEDVINAYIPPYHRSVFSAVIWCSMIEKIVPAWSDCDWLKAEISTATLADNKTIVMDKYHKPGKISNFEWPH